MIATDSLVLLRKQFHSGHHRNDGTLQTNAAELQSVLMSAVAEF